MTRDEIRDWALANGFSATAVPNRFSCPYRDTEVSLEFLVRAIRVTISGARGTHTIGTFNPGPNVRMNGHGIVEGIGLSASFAAGFVSPDPDVEAPAWMGEDYLRDIGLRPRADIPGR